MTKKVTLYPDCMQANYLATHGGIEADAHEKEVINDHWDAYILFVRKELKRDGIEVELSEGESPDKVLCYKIEGDVDTNEDFYATENALADCPGFWEWYNNPERKVNDEEHENAE